MRGSYLRQREPVLTLSASPARDTALACPKRQVQANGRGREKGVKGTEGGLTCSGGLALGPELPWDKSGCRALVGFSKGKGPV